MQQAIDKKRVLVYTTVFGVLWGVLEMLLGTWLHMMRFPFTGALMAGIGGVVVSAQGGLSVSRVIYDVKASFYVDGGYSFQLNTPYVESGVRVLKALSPNTAAGVGTYLQADGKGLRGGAGISLFTVITF